MGQTNLQNTKIKKLFLGNTKVRKMFLGSKQVYSSGSLVTYHIDTSNTQTAEVEEGLSVLSAISNPTKSGYSFLGWAASARTNSVYSTLLANGEEMHLYAVFFKTYTVTFNSGGASGSVASKTPTAYYNNGTLTNPTITLPSSSGLTAYSWNFNGWLLNSSKYSAGASYTVTGNVVFKATWELSNNLYIRNSAGSNISATKTGMFVFAPGVDVNGGYGKIEAWISTLDKTNITLSNLSIYMGGAYEGCTCSISGGIDGSSANGFYLSESTSCPSGSGDASKSIGTVTNWGTIKQGGILVLAFGCYIGYGGANYSLSIT